MDDIKFQVGTFQEFKVNKEEFHLGAIERTLFLGQIIEFDGMTVRFPETGEKHSIPSVMSAIKKGWMIPADQELDPQAPQPAGIMVRPADELKARAEGQTAKAAMMTTMDEERVVTSHVPTSSGAQIGSGTQVADDRNVISEASGQARLGAQSAMAKVVGQVGGGSSAVVGAEGEAQLAKPMKVTASSIGRLKHEQKSREKQHIENRASAKASGDGTSVADVLADDPDVAARREARRREALEAERRAGGDVARYEHSQDDGPEITFGMEDVDEAPRRRLQSKEEVASKEAEKQDLSSFKWDKTRHWRVRVEDAVSNYADKPKFMRKILGSETPNVAEKIQAKLEELGL